MIEQKTDKTSQPSEEPIDRYYYHIYNRGVEKREIFCDTQDYYRFLHDLYEFNDASPARPNSRRSVGSSTSNIEKQKIVEILCYCLMPNHFHLLISTTDKALLTQFMRKIGTGYTNYFNLKYDRVGSLFQGRYKSVIIESDEYLKQLSRYIHLNPLKTPGITNENLGKYVYSSYLDYIGKPKFPSIIDSALISDMFESKKCYKNFVLCESSEQSNMLTAHDLLE